MYLMQGVPAFNPESVNAGFDAGAKNVANIVSNLFAPANAQAQISQAQTAAQYAPAAAQASIAEQNARAQLYGGRSDYYGDLGNYKNIQGDVLQSGGNNPLAQLDRIQSNAMITGNMQDAMDANLAKNNYLAQQQAKINQQNAMAQNQQAEGAANSAKAVNLGSPTPYTTAVMPNSGNTMSNTQGVMQGGNQPMQGTQVSTPAMPGQQSSSNASMSPYAVQTKDATGNPVTLQPFSSYKPEDIEKLAASGVSVPPPIVGARQKPPTLALNSINALGNYMDNIDNAYAASQNPAVSNMYGSNISGLKNRLVGGSEGFLNMNNPGYSAYQGMLKSAPTIAEAGGRAMTGSVSYKAMLPFIKVFDPSNYQNPQQQQAALQQQAIDLKNKAISQLSNQYDNATRQTAWTALQKIVNSPTYKAAMQNPAYNPAQQQGAQSSPQAQGGAPSTIAPNVPDTFAQQYAKNQGWIK